jgi:hypothetical protein
MSVEAFEALSAEYQRKFKPAASEAQEIQRIAEFVRTFTPEGAVAMHLQRVAESDALVQQLGDGAITPHERLSFGADGATRAVARLDAVPAAQDLLIGGVVPRLPVQQPVHIPLDDFDSF